MSSRLPAGPALLGIGVVALLFSSIIETRIFIPLYPLLLPAVMFALLEPKPNTGEPSRVS